MTMAEKQADYKVQVSLTLPPTKQYQGSPMMNVRADDVDELEALLGGLRESANPVIKAFLDFAGGAPAPVSEAQAVENVENTMAVETFGTCPSCGKGTLARRAKKGTPQGATLSKANSFVGCDTFPDCKYIDKALSNK